MRQIAVCNYTFDVPFVPKAIEPAFRRIYPAEAYLKATSASPLKDSLRSVRLGEAEPHASQKETTGSM